MAYWYEYAVVRTDGTTTRQVEETVAVSLEAVHRMAGIISSREDVVAVTVVLCAEARLSTFKQGVKI